MKKHPLISLSIYFLLLYSAYSAKFLKSNYGITPTKPLSSYDNSTHINIYISPHTHNDIGWLKKIDEYYYGTRRDVQGGGGVQYILDDIVSELHRDPKKKFIYVEIGFFKRWWNEQDDDTKNLVKTLIGNGQLQFINGGYCMNDEAAVYYEDSIDQMTMGHQFLLQTLNVIPQIGWHIDPFGHAAAQAALFAQMGFQAFFFARIDYQDKDNRLKNSAMEMMWIPQTSKGNESAIFTVINYAGYDPPLGFEFDMYTKFDAIKHDPALQGYNLPEYADNFTAYFRQQSQSYRTTELFHTLGGDFAFQDGHEDFKNYDQLIRYINQHPEYNANVAYTTPYDYTKVINNKNVNFPCKYDDFFPYADNTNAFWTGYFTSRVSIKGAVRKFGKFTQAAKKLSTQALWFGTSSYASANFAKIDKALYVLEEAMAAAQHHDAVTGTEKQAVMEDYFLYLSQGESAVKNDVVYPLFQEQITKELGYKTLQFSTCELNTSSSFCNATWNSIKNNQQVLISIYNPTQARVTPVQLKVPNQEFLQIYDTKGNSLNTDIICANQTDATDCDLFFMANFTTGYSLNYFYLRLSNQSNLVHSSIIAYQKPYPISPTQSLTISSNLQTFQVQACTDETMQDCYSTNFNLKYNYYKSYQGLDPNVWEQLSGAYIFRPSNDTLSGSISYASPVRGVIYQGKNLLQVHIDFQKIITEIRIYGDLGRGVEVNTFVDSINIDDKKGKEIVMQVNVPSIANKDVFYTDSMGMEMQKRIVNYRPSWNYEVHQPASGNYYPIQSTIYIEDTFTKERLAVIPDRAEGGTSLTEGTIEVMLHRRLLCDDTRGVDDPLNETDWDGKGLRQWIRHVLLFSRDGYIETHYRQIQNDLDQANIVLLSPVAAEAKERKNPQKMEINDENLEMVKIFGRAWAVNKYLLRFQNMDEKETKNVSTGVFKNSAHGVGKVTEMSLTANQAKADMIKNRMNWNGMKLNDESFVNKDYLDSGTFALRPLEIRTFLVEFSASSGESAEKEEREIISI